MTRLLTLPQGLWFVDQYYRMLRWFERFQKINEGKPVTLGGALLDYDEVIAFFIFCDHLTDWILEDVYVSKNHPDYKKFLKLQNDVNNLKREDCFRLCTDICNSAKHKTLRKKIRYYEDTTVLLGSVEIIKTKNGDLIKQKWMIKTESGKEFDLFAVATECVQKWKLFLETHEVQIRELAPYWKEGHDTVSCDSKMMKSNTIESQYVKVHRVAHDKKKVSDIE